MSAEAIGPSWPHREMLADWLQRYRSFNSSRSYAEAFGRFIGSIGVGQDDVHYAILEYATHSDLELRFLAPFALARGWREDANTLLLLRDRATNDEASDVRYVAVRALAEYYREDANTLLLLRDRAKDDPAEWARHMIEALIN
jgi:hypothetical protein